MLFYLYSGRGFNYLYGGSDDIIITVCTLCDSLWNTLCRCTRRHHTSHT